RPYGPAPRTATPVLIASRSYSDAGAGNSSDSRSAEPSRSAERRGHFGDGHRAALVLEVLHQGDEPSGRHRGAVERVHGLELALTPEPDPESPGLVVGRIRRGRDLAVALLPWEPGLDVVLLRGRRPKGPARAVDDPVGKPDLLYQLLLDGKQ